jgi:hypothetical protein
VTDADTAPPLSKRRRVSRRLAAVWGVLSIVLVPLAFSGGPVKTTVVAVCWALLVGAASAGGQLLTHVRNGLVQVDDAAQAARVYRLSHALLAGLALAAGPALLCGLLAWALASGGSPRLGAAAFVVGGVITPLAIGRLPPPTVVRRRTSTRLGHVLDSALPTALLAGPFGTLILWTRLPVSAFADGALLRHFIGSTLLYALLLGMATFMKAWTEVAWGLVSEPPAIRRPPHPLLFGGLLCALWWALPIEALDDRGALIAKLLGGFTVALVVGAVGALRGQQTARARGQQPRLGRR